MPKPKKHHPHGRPPGVTYADELARKRRINASIDKAARDTTVRIEAETHTQRAMWLMVCSVADAYGIGPDRMQRFFTALQKNTDELERMRAETDEEYAFDKLRQKAEQVTRMKIKYLYELEALAAKVRSAKEENDGR